MPAAPASPLDLKTFANADGIGRRELEDRLRLICAEAEVLRRENRNLNDNVTATQKRCTELLETQRSHPKTRGAVGVNGPVGPSFPPGPPDPFDPEFGCPTAFGVGP